MSVRKLRLLWRGRFPLVATFLFLTAAVIAVPGVSNARAAVKQYLSEVSPGTVNGNTTGTSFTATITDCGGTPLKPPCTASSTIQLGSAQILVPTRFSNVSFVSATGSNGRNWTGSWDGTYIQAWAVTGADKLNASERVAVTFAADVSGCQTGSYEFTTTAWGSTPTHTGETFTPLAQPTVSVSGCALQDGGSITDPDHAGFTVTVGGGFEGNLNVSFGGPLVNCSSFTGGTQWLDNRLPNQVNFAPGDGYSPDPPGSPKILTFQFPATTGHDSSWYLICYGSPNDWTGSQGTQVINGETIHVGLLSPCYDPDTNTVRDPPCVSDQYLTTTSPYQVVITIRVPPGDPNGR